MMFQEDKEQPGPAQGLTKRFVHQLFLLLFVAHLVHQRAKGVPEQEQETTCHSWAGFHFNSPSADLHMMMFM